MKITWLDAEDFRDSTWANEDEAKAFGNRPCTIFSFGFLVSKTRSYVTIAADFTPDPDTYGRLMKIPKKMVVTIETIALPSTVDADLAESNSSNL